MNQDAKLTKQKLMQSGKIVILGYSPTGGGHASRLLDVAIQALRDGHLKQNDVVLIHLPNIHHAEPKFNPGLGPVDRAALKLTLRGVQVLMAVADKAVIGYLDHEGCSDNGAILKSFASYPYRNIAEHHEITDCALPWQENKGVAQAYGGSNDSYIFSEDKIQNQRVALEHTISAKALFQSLAQVAENILEKVYVISDMDPYLQKAAKSIGIPNERRLDQQTHAILIQNLDRLVENFQENTTANLLSGEERLNKKNAILAKVLDGTGSRVSHIALGQYNTLQRRLKDSKCLLEALTDGKPIDKNTLKKEVKQRVLSVLEQGARRIPLDIIYDGAAGGIMKHPDLALSDAQRIIYVYIHGGSMINIADHIRRRITSNDEDYKNKVFLFCRAGAIKQTICPACRNLANPNALELAYLAGADGITNTGGGTTGEFAFLHRAGGDTSHVAFFPQISQHEQETNANFVVKLLEPEAVSSVETFTLVGNLKANYTETLDQLVKRKYDANAEEGTMDRFFTGILLSDSSFTISKQASDILFGERWETDASVCHDISIAEQEMRNNAELTAHRRYLKLIITVLARLEEIWLNEIRENEAQTLTKGFFKAPISLKLKQKDVPILHTQDINDISLYLRDPNLQDNLYNNRPSINTQLDESPIQAVEKERVFTNYSKINSFFSGIAHGKYTNESAKDIAQALLKEFGEQITLGF